MKRRFVLTLTVIIVFSFFLASAAEASSYHDKTVDVYQVEGSTVPKQNADSTEMNGAAGSTFENQKNDIFSDFSPEQYEPRRVLLDIKTSQGGLFRKYDIEVYIDDQLICAIKNGDSYKGVVEVKSGNHFIRFLRKYSKENIIAKNLDISENSTIKCTLIRASEGLEIEMFEFSRGIIETNILNLETTKIDAYNFTFGLGYGGVRTKRGWSRSFEVYDLTNGIRVYIHRSHVKGEDKDFYSVDMIKVIDGKIWYLNDGEWSKGYCYIEGGVLYSVNETGELVNEKKISEINQLRIKSLEEIGFYEEYPSPSSVYAAMRKKYNSDSQ